MNQHKEEFTNKKESSDSTAMNANQKNNKGFAEKAAQGTPESSKKAPPVDQSQSEKRSNPKDSKFIKAKLSCAKGFYASRGLLFI